MTSTMDTDNYKLQRPESMMKGNKSEHGLQHGSPNLSIDSTDPSRWPFPASQHHNSAIFEMGQAVPMEILIYNAPQEITIRHSRMPSYGLDGSSDGHAQHDSLRQAVATSPSGQTALPSRGQIPQMLQQQMPSAQHDGQTHERQLPKLPSEFRKIVAEMNLQSPEFAGDDNCLAEELNRRIFKLTGDDRAYVNMDYIVRTSPTGDSGEQAKEAERGLGDPWQPNPNLGAPNVGAQPQTERNESQTTTLNKRAAIESRDPVSDIGTKRVSPPLNLNSRNRNPPNFTAPISPSAHLRGNSENNAGSYATARESMEDLTDSNQRHFPTDRRHASWAANSAHSYQRSTSSDSQAIGWHTSGSSRPTSTDHVYTNRTVSGNGPSIATQQQDPKRKSMSLPNPSSRFSKGDEDNSGYYSAATTPQLRTAALQPVFGIRLPQQHNLMSSLDDQSAGYHSSISHSEPDEQPLSTQERNPSFQDALTASPVFKKNAKQRNTEQSLSDVKLPHNLLHNHMKTSSTDIPMGSSSRRKGYDTVSSYTSKGETAVVVRHDDNSEANEANDATSNRSSHHKSKSEPVSYHRRSISDKWKSSGSAKSRRNFSKKSLENMMEEHPSRYDINDIGLPAPERRLLEKFIDSLSKLSIEVQMDESKREEGRRRLNNALRALEGWI